jgi:hypothetical protein
MFKVQSDFLTDLERPTYLDHVALVLGDGPLCEPLGDKDGLKLGKIDALLIDDADRKVRFLEVETGGFLSPGERKSLIPIDAIATIDDHEVHIDQNGRTVAAAPTYHPALVDETVLGNTYEHYGFLPYWGAGYAYPGFPYIGEDS